MSPVGSTRQAVSSGSGFSSAPFVFRGINPSDHLGESVVGVGDVNGDGYDDLAVGMPGWEAKYPPTDWGDYGRVYLFFGSAMGLSATNVQILNGVREDQRNAMIVRAGDVNGDGYADVLIQGTLNYNAHNPLAPVGETGLQLYLGGPTGLATTPAWNIPIYVLKPRGFGGVGDLNGDGRAEVLVSVSEWKSSTSSWEYRVELYQGTAAGLSTTPIWSYVDACVRSGAGVGDLNGDGYNDIVLGTDPLCSTGPMGRSVLGFFGSSTGMPTTPSWSADDADYAFVGNEIAGLGDVNGDGYADFAATSFQFARFDFEPAAYVYLGGATPSKTPAWKKRFYEDLSGSIATAGVGDPNGDGLNDVVFGLDYFFNPDNGKGCSGIECWPPLGRAQLFLGTTTGTGVGLAHSWYGYDDTVNRNNFAGCVTGAGDLNGDGFPDLGAGDIWDDSDQRGKLHVFYGAGGSTTTKRALSNLEAHDVGGTTAIPAGGWLSSSSAFDIVGKGVGTEGRTRVALEVEVKPSASPFDGKSLVRSTTWVDTGLAGADVVVHVTGLSPATSYKYRARLVYRPDAPVRSRHTRWFDGAAVVTDCDTTSPDLDKDGVCDDRDLDDDGDGVADTLDCKPRDASIHPGAVEVPDDGVDQDCDGSDSVTCFADADGDSFGATKVIAVGACLASKGLSSVAGDCDDTAASVHPGASEIAGDGIDQDCDGKDSMTCYVDGDGDGVGATAKIVAVGSCVGAGWSTSGGDCDDGDPARHPGAVEVPDDGIDQDCSGADSVTCYTDDDGDGFGADSAGTFEKSCDKPGVVARKGDCDDKSSAVHPGAAEIPGDGIDQDCNGADAPIVDAGTPPDDAADAASSSETSIADDAGSTEDSGSKTEAGSGCGCRVADERASSSWASSVVLGVALALARRRTKRRRAALTIALSSAALLTTACSGESSDAPDGGFVDSTTPETTETSEETSADTEAPVDSAADTHVVDADASDSDACVVDADCLAKEDGNRCNGTLVCRSGACVVDPATIVECDRTGDTICASHQCAPSTGECVIKNALDGTSCDDGSSCTHSDSCRLGVCKGTPVVCPLSCQSCDGTLGCEPEPGWCTIEGACVADGTLRPFAKCQWCAAASAPMAWSLQPAGTVCNDFDSCSPTDACDGAGTCIGTSVLAPTAPVLRGLRFGKLTGSALATGIARIAQPTFRWRVSGDGCTSPTFDVQIDDSCTNVGMQTCTFPSPEATATGITTDSWQVPTPLPISKVAPVGTRYFWRVRACRGTTCSPWSRVGYVDVGRVKNDFDGDGRSDLVVGAYWGTALSGTAGSVFVYPGRAGGPSSTPTLEIPSPVAELYSHFGWRLASGDVNGDGYADLAVGASHQPTGYAGRLYVYFGGPSGLSATPSQTIDAPKWWENFEPFPHGLSVAGDLNGDGFADIVAGQDTVMNGPVGWVFFGSPTGASLTFSDVFPNPPPLGTDHKTRLIATDVDVDGDAFADALLAMPAGSLPVGWVHVYTGGTGVLEKPSLSVSADPSPTTNTFAQSMTCGDFNGDGYGDAVVGDETRTAGTVLLYPGAATGLPAAPRFPVTSPTSPQSMRLGMSLAAGDVDGDGLDDLLAGAPNLGSSGTQPGGAFLYRGATTGLQGTPATSLTSPVADAYGHFGNSVSIPGDVDGDGRADAVIAGYDIDGSTARAGAVFVYLGTASGLAASPIARMDMPAKMKGTGYGSELLP